MMSFAQNKRTIEKFVEEIFNKDNFAPRDEIFASGFVNHTPYFGLPTTLDGLEQLYRILRIAFPDQHAVIDEIQPVGDDAAVVRFTIEGTHGGPLMRMPPTGRHVVYSGLMLLRFDADGKLTERWEYHDELGLLQQLGMVPMPVEASAPQPSKTHPTI